MKVSGKTARAKDLGQYQARHAGETAKRLLLLEQSETGEAARAGCAELCGPR